MSESSATALLNRLDTLLERVERLESKLQYMEQALHELPGIAATAVNTLDQLTEPLRQQASDWPERLPLLLELLEKLSQPHLLETLTTLANRQNEFLPLLKLAGDLPGILSMGVDTLDNFYSHSELHRLDPDRLLRSLRTGILDVETVAVVAAAGQALARSRADTQPASLVALFKALNAPEFRQSLGFALSFVHHFGRALQPERTHS